MQWRDDKLNSLLVDVYTNICYNANEDSFELVLACYLAILASCYSHFLYDSCFKVLNSYYCICPGLQILSLWNDYVRGIQETNYSAYLYVVPLLLSNKMYSNVTVHADVCHRDEHCWHWGRPEDDTVASLRREHPSYHERHFNPSEFFRAHTFWVWHLCPEFHPITIRLQRWEDF